MATLSLEIDSIVVPKFNKNLYEFKVNKFESELAKVGFTGLDLLNVLNSNSTFADALQRMEVLDLKIDQIGEGKGFLSQVFKLVVEFTNGKIFNFIMKVPKPFAFQEFMGNWSKDADNEGVLVDQFVVEGHNAECDFYTQIRSLKGCPIPKVYVAQKYISEKEPGILLMDNLALNSETLGFDQGATVDQCFIVARCIAALQYRTDTEELKEWREQKSTPYFEDVYSIHLPNATQAIRNLEGIEKLLPKLKPILSRSFGFYSLFEQPKENGTLSLCHGDLQPNNLMFERLKSGEITSKLNAIIDWQILFWGNSSFDLARFMILCTDVEVRKQIEVAAYAAYYSELQRLYEKDGKTPNFSYEQGLVAYEMALCQQITFLLFFVGITKVMHPGNTGPLAYSFDRMLESTVYASERAIEIFEKHNLYNVFD